MRLKYSINEIIESAATKHWWILSPLFVAIAVIAYLAVNLSITPRIGKGVWNGINVKYVDEKPDLNQVCKDYPDIKIEGNKVSGSIANYPQFKACIMTTMAMHSDLVITNLCINDDKCNGLSVAEFSKHSNIAEKTVVHSEY
jgi:hypothetical protein